MRQIKKKIKQFCLFFCVLGSLILIASCTSLSGYSYNPYITIVNQYDYPMEISFSDYNLKPSSVTKVIPAKSEYKLYFPNGYSSMLSIKVKGILFTNYHSELAFVSSYGTETITPEADYGFLGIEYKKTILSDVSEIYVEYAGERDLYTLNSLSAEKTDPISTFSSIKAIAFETQYIRVSADTYDYLYVSENPFWSPLAEKKPVGDKIRVKKGEVLIVTVSYKNSY